MSQGESLELAMRLVLRLFSESRLVYRSRVEVVPWDARARAKKVKAVA